MVSPHKDPKPATHTLSMDAALYVSKLDVNLSQQAALVKSIWTKVKNFTYHISPAMPSPVYVCHFDGECNVTPL